MENPTTMSADEVRKVAKLCRLSLDEEQVALYATQLTGVLRYADRLRNVDLAGAQPMPHVGDTVNRLDEDVPGPVLEHDTLMKMAPETLGPFVRVPKVFGDEGGA